MRNPFVGVSDNLISIKTPMTEEPFKVLFYNDFPDIVSIIVVNQKLIVKGLKDN